jgi:ABC-type transport system involved in multi-copper enzyme maturation permease subunit
MEVIVLFSHMKGTDKMIALWVCFAIFALLSIGFIGGVILTWCWNDGDWIITFIALLGGVVCMIAVWGIWETIASLNSP